MDVFLNPYVISIFINATQFDAMSLCTKTMYHSETDYHVCDYYDAMASFGETNISMPIEIRRKGTSTWSEMTQKPSFKLKLEDDINFGEYECTENKCNVWQADKLTLNNQMFRDVEETTFKVFRDNGIIAPLARRVIVSLYKGYELLRIDNYTMIETIKIKSLLKNIGEKTHRLHYGK